MRTAANKRSHLLDRIATVIITAGGAIVIIAVVLILVLIAAEAVPLFRSVRSELAGEFAALPVADSADSPIPLAVGTDEYLENGYALSADGVFRFFSLADESSRGQLASAAPAGATRVRAVHAVGTGTTPCSGTTMP